MIEQEPIPLQEPKIQYAPVTSFDQLGILDTRQRIDTVTSGNLACLRVNNPIDGSTAYISFHGHGYLGNDLSEIANSVAPIKTSGPRVAMTDDFRMPIRVEAGRGLLGEAELHHDHMEDPVIREQYKDFISNHNQRWDAALVAHNPFAFTVNRIGFIDSQRLVVETFEERVQALDIYSHNPHSEQALIDLAHYGRALLHERGQHANKFMDFLAQRLMPEDVVREDLSREVEYFFLSPQRKIEVLQEYLGHLDEESQHEFAMNYQVNRAHILVDPKRGKSWITRDSQLYLRDVRVNVVDDSTVVVENKVKGKDERAVVKVKETVGEKEQKSWKITDITSSVDTNEIQGVLAWLKTTDGRRFLTQQELTDLLPSNNPHLAKSDVFLGRIIAAYLSPAITSQWPKAMLLQHRNRPQRMMAAQAAVWTSIDGHAQQLLSDQNSVITTLESYIDDNAA